MITATALYEGAEIAYCDAESVSDAIDGCMEDLSGGMYQGEEIVIQVTHDQGSYLISRTVE